MNTRTIITRGAAAAVVAALLTASPAAAQLGAASVDCRATIAKSYGKLLKTANKTIAGCHKARDKDAALAAMDCNDMAVADLAKGKYAGAVTKFTAAIAGDCTGQDAVLTSTNVAGGPEYYVSCPVDPCTGVTGALTTMAEVGSCLGCTAALIAETAGADTMGLPVPPLDKGEQKCHGAIAKGYGKYLSTGQKNESACQGDADEAGNNSLTSCQNTLAGDPKGKTASSLAKAAAGLDKACAGVTIADLDGCSAVDLASLKTCTAALWGTAEDDAFTTAYELPALICPSAVRTTILGGCSTQGSVAGDCSSGFETGTVLSVGWKGLAHGVDITDSYIVAVDVTCGGTVKGACGTCTSAGISIDNPQYNDFTRCIDDTAIACTNPFGTDPACPSAGACRYFLGAPLAVSAGGTPTCTLNVVNTDIIGGTGNPDLGTANFTVDLRSVVHLGVSQSRPCPICRNDPTPQDGVKAGTCLGGFHDDGPCDVQAFDLSFAPTDVANPTAGHSLDCPPTSGANISGSGLAIILPLTTGLSSKDAVDPCEAPNAALSCFCGVCSGNPTVACNSDAECAGMLLGTCGIGGGVDRKPNNCTDGHCWPQVPPRTDRGQCSSNGPVCVGGAAPTAVCTTNADCPGGGGVCDTTPPPPDVDSYCSGVLFANGKGVIACGVDADCDSYVSGSVDPDLWVCPGNDCGTCSIAAFRSCFLDPIDINGTADPLNPILAGTFCLPPSSNGSVNSATGSPGPGVVQTDTIVELRY